MKICQVVAIEKGVKSGTTRKLTDAHHALQKPALLEGISRRYTPKDDDSTKPTGEVLPDQLERVQIKAEDILTSTAAILTEWFDITALKEWGNYGTGARANIELDGKVLLENVPVTYMLFLEKRLVDLHTFVQKLPVLSPGEVWTMDANTGWFKTETSRKERTKKVPQAIVLYPATKEHPAQVVQGNEDILVGYWDTVKFSGALPADRANILLARVEKLQKAVKAAREQANLAEVTSIAVGKQIFDYLFS